MLAGTLCAAVSLFGETNAPFAAASEVQTFRLQYASAKEVAGQINELMSREAGPDGKLLPETLEAWLSAHFADGNRDHLVWPGMVYLSQPTELGTLYSKAELTSLHAIAQRYSLPLYIDGARLSYALACPGNDISLPELAELCEAFYIGGTKTGALIGEAVVFPHHGSPAHFMSTIKQCGALLAKGRLLGIQFDVLFTDGLYLKLAANAIKAAADIRAALAEAGIPLAVQSPTNQTFAILTKAQQAALEAEGVAVCWWESIDKDRDVVRFASSWATAEEDTAALREILCRISRA